MTRCVVGAGRTGEGRPRPIAHPAPTVTGKGTAYLLDHSSLWRAPISTGTRRLLAEELGVIQGFPADYPWQGNSGSRYRQVGDAIPPLLAAAVLKPLLALTGAVEERTVA